MRIWTVKMKYCTRPLLRHGSDRGSRESPMHEPRWAPEREIAAPDAAATRDGDAVLFRVPGSPHADPSEAARQTPDYIV